MHPHAHALRLFNFLIARNHPVRIGAIVEPRSKFASLLEVFSVAQAQEHEVSRQIDELYEMALTEKVFAAMAELQTTEFEDTWHGFFTDAKAEAYQADSRVTTHPVEMPVNSTLEFFEVFDAITYEKGASVLKQLAHYVGEENYRNGVSALFCGKVL